MTRHGQGAKQIGPSRIEIIARSLVVLEEHVFACRNRESGYFYLPGGHVEPGESAANACERELLEEIGISTRTRGCLLVAEVRFHQNRRIRHEINFVFHVELGLWIQNSPRDLPEVRSLEAGIAFEWIPLARLAEFDLRPSILRGWIASGFKEGSLISRPLEFMTSAE